MEFTPGQRVIYPSYGVARVEKIESKEVAGSSSRFYVLKIESSGATLFVPILTSSRVGLRDLLDDREVANVYDILQSKSKLSQRAWNRRLKEFNEKLRAGSAYELAEVVRDLFALQITKHLSYGEKRIYEKCISLLVDEIGASIGLENDEVMIRINTLLTQTNVILPN